MDSEKLPALQFYVGDWRKDPGVQSLCFHDRGVWFEILCLMHESTERGKLMLNGQPMPEDALARTLGLDKQILTTTLSTLLTYGVASKDEDTGAFMCRRMVRDEKLRQIRKSAGKLGGNPVLVKQKSTTQLKQIPTPSSSSSASAEIEIEPPPGFPESERAAIEMGASAGALPETCRLAYHMALSRGYRDHKDIPIRNWRAFVKSSEIMNANRRVQNGMPEKPKKQKPRTCKDFLLLPLGNGRWDMENPPKIDQFKSQNDFETAMDAYRDWQRKRKTDFYES